MKLSPLQQHGYETILSRLRRGERLTKMAGYAGTGKTVLGRVFMQRHADEFAFRGACPTGIASARQRDATGMPSQTLHTVFWRGAKGVDDQGDLIWGKVDSDRIRETLAYERTRSLVTGDVRKVLWIDEGSMIDLEMAKKVMANVPEDVCIIVSGDPFQLQPPKGRPGFDLENPDVMLSEVHRQALDSPIVRLATWIRTMERRPRASDFEHFGVPYFTAKVSPLCEAISRRRGHDAAVVVHTHIARKLVNRGVRHHLGYPSMAAGPAPGELLMVRRNCRPLGLFNGSTVRVRSTSPFRDELMPMEFFRVQFQDVSGTVWIPKESWEEDRKLTYEENQVAWDSLFEFLGKDAALAMMEASPGFASTCHSWQGSQFPYVFVIDEGTRDPRWWYTASTRAEESLVVGQIADWKRIKESEKERQQKEQSPPSNQATTVYL